MFRYSVLFFLLFFSFVGYPQVVNSEKDILANGKTLFAGGRYDQSMEVLHPLTLKLLSPYAPYACFYYMLSSYRKDFRYVALEMINYLIVNFPKWKDLDEARLWQVKIYSEDKNFSAAYQSLLSVKSNEIRKMAENLFLDQINEIKDYVDLVKLYNLNAENPLIGRVLADRILSGPVFSRDNDLLKEVIIRAGLDKNRYKYDEMISGTKKEHYKIAVLFPFLVKDLIPGKSNRSNQFVYDIYQGILLANQQLSKEKINLDVIAYDVSKSAEETRRIINSGELNGVDVIIGPLYSDPVQVISDFSNREQIMVINPLSTNSDIIKNNPYSLLFKPSTERQAVAAADYARLNLTANKNYMVFYGKNSRDSLSALTYLSELKNDSFNLNLIHHISPKDTFDLYKTLTKKIKIKDLNLNTEDSAKLLSHYVIDLKAIEEAGKKVEDQELLIIYPDSIGHVFGASSNELIATSIISGVETRADHTYIIGNEDWLEIKQLSLDQLDRLNIILTAPGFVDINNPNLEAINNFIISNFHSAPNKYDYLGYEILMYLGHMLGKYGSPFVFGLKNEGFYKGKIYYGINYSDGRDNNIVPIIEFIDGNFKVVNNPSAD
jgi:hypothetical protein